MPTIQFSLARGGSLDHPVGGQVTEASGGGAPTGLVDVNVANNAPRAEVLAALQTISLKILQSTNFSA